MTGELIEADFTAKRFPDALADDVLVGLNEVRTTVAGLGKHVRELDVIEARRKQLVRDLRRQLADERALNERGDEDVLRAIEELPGRVVSASEVAERLHVGRPTHSAVVRVGLALSRLAAAGRVSRVEVAAHGEVRNRWEAQ